MLSYGLEHMVETDGIKSFGTSRILLEELCHVFFFPRPFVLYYFSKYILFESKLKILHRTTIIIP